MATHIHFHSSDGKKYSVGEPSGPTGNRGPRGPVGVKGPVGNKGSITNIPTTFANIFNVGSHREVNYSTNAYTWTPGNNYLIERDDTSLNGIVYGSNLWVGVASGCNTIQVSKDGYNWQAASNGGFLDGQGKSVAYNGSNKWVAVGNGSSSIQVSTDGYNWIPASNGNFASSCYGVAFGDNKWVAVGVPDSNGQSSIQVSTDGHTWTPASNGGFSIVSLGVGYGANKWVAVGISDNGQRSSIQISTDGYNWTPASNGGFDNNYGVAVAYNGSNKWVVVGSGPSSIQVSSNGYNWSPSSNGGFSGGNYGTGITYAGNKWVAVGNGPSSIQVSTDGYNWSSITTSIDSNFCVAYGVAQNKTEVGIGFMNVSKINNIPIVSLQAMYQQWLSNGGIFNI